jgi:D-alanyl-D-alanine carboxypeptidase
MIMTFYTAMNMATQLNIDPNNTLMYVSEEAEKLKGSSCHLKKGDLVSFMDLLYGMMLASGNDAAQVIAENMGKLWEDIKGQQAKGQHWRTSKNVVVEMNGKGDSKNGESLF